MVVALLLVHRRDLLHLFTRQREVEEVEVVLDVGGVLGTGDDDVARLDVPAEDDLGIGLAVLLAQLSKQRLLDQRLVAVAQRVPGLDDNALFIQEGFQFLFLGVGMDLGLEDGGFASQTSRIS